MPGRYSNTLEDLLSWAGHSSEELCGVVDFLSHILIIIDPKEGWSAAQLLNDLWSFSFLLSRRMLLTKIQLFSLKQGFLLVIHQRGIPRTVLA